MSALKPSTRILPVALTVFFVITLSIFKAPHVPKLHQLVIPQLSTKCILYDRPPRTGSTTISKALGRCLAQKNYSVVSPLGSHNRTSTIREMLSQQQQGQLAAVKSHIAVSGKDIEQLRNHCGELLYVTSCAPMKKRLYSAAKYSMTSGHGNTTLEGDRKGQVLRWLKTHIWVERVLEAYPHVSEERRPLDVIPERMLPDYVIRSEKLDEDLGRLLKVLGCNFGIRRRNVHEASFNDSEIVSGIEMKMGDYIYHWLMDIAQDNEKGLQKAKEF